MPYRPMNEDLGRAGAGPSRREAIALTGALSFVATMPGAALASETKGQLTYAVHVSLAPIWFDPADVSGIITPFLVLYAVHDAMVKPMPTGSTEPCLAESVRASEDGLTYEFVMRQGATFHNGDPVTAEDVKFSFDRYRGTANDLLKDRVASVEAVDDRRVSFRLKKPWPDFLTFYASATGAGWVVPKKYIERVGDEGFKKAPVGAGPYKFVSFTPGVELVLEAHESYWRKRPSVQRLVFKVIPDEATRLAALRRGEVDIAYSIRGELGQALQKTPGLALRAVVVQAPFCLYFADQWDPKSPWHDVRVRQAASLSIDRQGTNDALMLGFSAITGNAVVPQSYDFFWKPPPPITDLKRSRELLAAAGHASGFDAGEYWCDSSYANLGETMVDNLRSVGIRTKLRPIERAAFIKGFAEKKYKNIIQAGPGAFGNAATRMEAHAVTGGIFVYGSYPDLDELYQKQAVELDRGKRESMLHRMQQIVHERVIYAPIWQLAFLNGIGPRVGESAFGTIAGYPYTSPYEDLTLKGA